MGFRVGEFVRVRKNDLARGGEMGRVREVMPARPGAGGIREYLLEFQDFPAKLHTSSERFLMCIYKEEDLSSC
jgi:hypothetical protein